MGSTVSESDSRRITMGMLVTGSIIRPRIFISTSIVGPSLDCSVIRQMRWECKWVGWRPDLDSDGGSGAHEGKPLADSEQLFGTGNVWTSGYGFRAKLPRDDLPRQQFAQQAVGERLRDPYTDVIACCGFGTAVGYEIQGLVLGGTPDDLFAGLVLAFNHYFNLLTQVAAIALALDLA